MQVLKVVGLGLLFSFFGTVGLLILDLFFGVIRGSVTTGPQHASGVTSLLGALKHATLYNPYYWLGIIAAFFAAFWVVRRKRNA